jgi:23S rRNA pseudouridine1911/1915/1917 synthase
LDEVVTPVIRTVITDRGDVGRRLDLVLRRHLADARAASRTQIQAWIESGRVSVNGRAVRRVGTRVKPGDVAGVALPTCSPRPCLAAEEIPLDVLYEDDHLLAINKAPGIVVHPSYRNTNGTLMNALLWHARGWPQGRRPSLVGRLDKLTSGLVLIAKTAAVHSALQRVMALPSSRKEYLAVVYGRVPAAQGTITLCLALDPGNRRKVVVSPSKGAASVTEFERLARVAAPRAGLSLLRCRLITGRRHQIRIHLAASGWPLVGDPSYGEPRWMKVIDPGLAATLSGFPRQALHAWRAAFTHPVSGEPTVIEAPVPEDLAALINAAGLAVPVQS